MATPMRLPLRRERTEDEFVTAFFDMLAVMRRLHDLSGDPNIREIILRAEAALGRVPR
jgi:hypothetical protein